MESTRIWYLIGMCIGLLLGRFVFQPTNLNEKPVKPTPCIDNGMVKYTGILPDKYKNHVIYVCGRV